MLVGNLPLEASEDELATFFSTVGKVSRLEILRDNHGRGRGFAFVTMVKGEDTEHAIEKMHNAEFKGRILSVSAAEASHKQKKKPGIFGFCR